MRGEYLVLGVSYRSQVMKVINEHSEAVAQLDRLAEDVGKVACALAECLRGGNKILICGNGGSAADAQHIAAELVGRFARERRAYPVMALTTNTSVLTAIGNDYSFGAVFARQVEAYGRKGDVLLAISTSGNSLNVLRAVEVAKDLGMKVVGLTGAGDGRMKNMCDWCLCVPSTSTPRIQEMHILLGHIICELVEEALC